MKKPPLLFITFMMISACGSADNFLEDMTEWVAVDSIIVNPANPSDSTNSYPSDSIIVINDSTAVPKDSTSGNNDSIPSDSLHVKDKPEIAYSKLFQAKSISRNYTQGIAIYDKYLFNCHHSNDVIDVYDLETQKIITYIQLEPDAIIHCNNVNFGAEFYSPKDKFPLLYIQQRGYACKLNVYRIICDGDSIVTIEKLQTISFESCNSCINTIDIKNNLLYSIYTKNDINYISSFRMPSVKEGDVCINPKFAYKTYYCPFKKVRQDTAFGNNCLNILCGNKNEGELWQIDITNKTAKVIDLTKYGMNAEPEGIDIYKGDLIVSFLNAPFYKIRILDY